jgi:hypothetical protein
MKTDLGPLGICLTTCLTGGGAGKLSGGGAGKLSALTTLLPTGSGGGGGKDDLIPENVGCFVAVYGCAVKGFAVTGLIKGVNWLADTRATLGGGGARFVTSFRPVDRSRVRERLKPVFLISFWAITWTRSFVDWPFISKIDSPVRTPASSPFPPATTRLKIHSIILFFEVITKGAKEPKVKKIVNIK